MKRYNPADHYWRRKNGTVFSSRHNLEMPETDERYRAFLAEGGIPARYPRNQDNEESIAELDALLAPYGLRASPVTPREARKDAYIVEIDAIKEEAEHYHAEAYAWGLRGDADKRRQAQEQADRLFLSYLTKKEEIRQRFMAPLKIAILPSDEEGRSGSVL